MYISKNKKLKVGIVACSNGISPSIANRVEELISTLQSIGLEPVLSKYIYERNGIFSGTARERAEALMQFYQDDEISEIFDISGGDVANGILPYLDFDRIAKSQKRFWGYSDLTTVLNAIYTKTGKPSVLYQIRNIMWGDRGSKLADLKKMLEGQYEIQYEFLQGKSMEGILIGGNIRCFLKLAGTEYMPDFQDKILLLESRGGTVAQMETYLSQLKQLGVFEKISGVLLGTFTQMEAECCVPTMKELVLGYVKEGTPVAVTREIGHGKDAKGVLIGKTVFLFDVR